MAAGGIFRPYLENVNLDGKKNIYQKTGPKGSLTTPKAPSGNRKNRNKTSNAEADKFEVDKVIQVFEEHYKTERNAYHSRAACSGQNKKEKETPKEHRIL